MYKHNTSKSLQLSIFQKNNKLCKKVAKKFGKSKMFIVPLHRRSKMDRAGKRDVRGANVMRTVAYAKTRVITLPF